MPETPTSIPTPKFCGLRIDSMRTSLNCLGHFERSGRRLNFLDSEWPTFSIPIRGLVLGSSPSIAGK
jgi:hypothetical protein